MERWELYKIFSVFSKYEIVDGIKNRFYEQDEDINKEGIEDIITELKELIDEE